MSRLDWCAHVRMSEISRRTLSACAIALAQSNSADRPYSPALSADAASALWASDLTRVCGVSISQPNDSVNPRENVAQGMAITATRKNRMMIRRCGSYVFQFSGARRQETTFLIEFKLSLMVLVEGTCERSDRSGMPSSEDYRQLAERGIRLAKACTRPAVAE
jgi:hypothetical protein